MWTVIRLGLTTWKGFLKILPYILVFVVVGYAGYSAYKWADNKGASRVQAQWNKETEDYKRAITALKVTLIAKEQDHRLETTRISDALVQEKFDHQEDVAAITADFAVQLRNSETRTALYQRQAQGGPASCVSLASYTTELDNLLTEGRSLVKEGRSLVELRDRQLTLVGQQLLADRKLFTDQEAGK